jgi:tRNA uridine 5-carboxymethylaminomethyl modification enzyme
MSFLQNEKIRGKDMPKMSLKDRLRKPGVSFHQVMEESAGAVPDLTSEEIRHIESEVKYEGYLRKQEKEIARMQKMDKERIPSSLDFQKVPGLTREIIEKLKIRQPKTIAEVKTIPGMTPAAVINLHVFIKLESRKTKKHEK